MSKPTPTVETLHLAHTPPNVQVHISCFRNVSNATFLRSQLLAANQEFNYAFIDGTTLTSRRHLLAAVFRALTDAVHDRLKSNNVHSEIVFCLSPTNNIGDAFRRFGVQDSTAELVVVKVGGMTTATTTNATTAGTSGSIGAAAAEVTAESVQAHLGRVVEGTQVAFDDELFVRICDLEKVRKIYKLGSGGGGGNSAKSVSAQSRGQKVVNGGGGNAMNEREEIEAQVLGLMALRGAT